MTDDVEGLISRIEKATEGSRELDRELWELATGHPVKWASADVFEPETVVTMEKYGAGAVGNPTYTLDPFTSSIDAALALTERLLPGSWWLMAKGRVRAGEPLYALQLFSEGHNPFTSLPIAEAEHETLCCAILLATLRAKRSSP